jgi:hypothetical protein
MQCFCNSWRVRNLLVMVLRLNQSCKYHELIPTPDCSGPAPTFVRLYSEYSTPRVVSTMPYKTSFRCAQFSCRKMFTSDSWRHNHIKLHHPEHLEVARQKTLPVHSAHQGVEPAQRREFNANKNSVDNLDAFPYLELHEHIPYSKYQLPPPSWSRTETCPGAGALLSAYIAGPLECNPLGYLEMNLQNNPYYLSVTCQEYIYIQCGIKKKGMKTYYDNVLKEEYIAQRFPSFKNGDCIQTLMACMPDDLPLGQWEIHTLEDMKWNDNHQRPINYWS